MGGAQPHTEGHCGYAHDIHICDRRSRFPDGCRAMRKTLEQGRRIDPRRDGYPHSRCLARIDLATCPQCLKLISTVSTMTYVLLRSCAANRIPVQFRPCPGRRSRSMRRRSPRFTFPASALGSRVGPPLRIHAITRLFRSDRRARHGADDRSPARRHRWRVAGVLGRR